MLQEVTGCKVTKTYYKAYYIEYLYFQTLSHTFYPLLINKSLLDHRYLPRTDYVPGTICRQCGPDYEWCR